jgi:hypothetical protein
MPVTLGRAVAESFRRETHFTDSRVAQEVVLVGRSVDVTQGEEHRVRTALGSNQPGEVLD